MKKRNLIIAGSSIIAIMVIALAILGYSMTQNNIVGEKEIAKESEPYSEENVDNEICYVTVEENEESKLNSIKAKEMAKSSAGVTIQQGNIVVSMDTNLTIDSSIANYRTKYGIGETVVVKVYFDKEIREETEATEDKEATSGISKDTCLWLRFGTGTERKVIPSGYSGSVITFKYKIQEGDNGELKLTNLSGEVTDKDNNSIIIGLSQSGSIQYQDTSKIIADTIRSKAKFSKFNVEDHDDKMEINIRFEEEIYKIVDGKITKIDQEDFKKIGKVIFQITKEDGVLIYYDGKGTYSGMGDAASPGDNETIIEGTYTLGTGDRGLATYTENYKDYCDIAGNAINGHEWDGSSYGSVFSDVQGTQTPYAISATVDIINEDNAPKGYRDQDRYLKAGKKIRIGILYNEKVYKDDKQNDLEKNAGHIIITFENQSTNPWSKADKEVPLVEWSHQNTGTYCVYEYVIKEEDGKSVSTDDDIILMKEKIEIPENQVYDNVGHGNPARIFEGFHVDGVSGSGEITTNGKPLNIHIDTTKPVGGAYIDNQYGSRCFKNGQEIKGEFQFSEDMRIGEIKYKFEDEEQKNATLGKSGILEKGSRLEYKVNVANGDNGKLCLYLNKFTDLAGNSFEAIPSIPYPASYNQYADTTPPNLSISHAYEEERAISKYTFTLTDNSTAWKKSDGTLMANGGIAQNSLTLDDINLRNGTILDSTTDSDGNLKTITVLNDKEGTQKIDIKSGAWSDAVGNLAGPTTITTTIDTKKPIILSTDISPDVWTNQDVTIRVNALDETSGIAGYSYNGGEYGAEDTYVVDSESPVTVKIKVKDGSGLESDEKSVTVKNIDKTKPTLELSKQQNGKESATIIITGSDSKSGIASCSINGIDITLENGTYQFNATQNGIYTVTIVDRAGNSVTKTINITNIDNTVVTDATILYTANGGTYTLSQDSRVNLSDKINVINTAINKIEYAWTQSEEEPSTWTYAGNTTGLSVEYEATKAGKYYLHIKVTDSSGHVTTSHSNAFVVKAFPISVDKSVVIKSIQGINYIILPKESDVNELLGKITSNEYTIKIKNSECTQDITGKIRTGDVVVAEGTEKYKLYKICVKGDINKDGLINIDDIFQLNQYRLGKIEFDAEQLFVANVDDNDEINIKDIFQINQYRLGKIENF